MPSPTAERLVEVGALLLSLVVLALMLGLPAESRIVGLVYGGF